jgi:predicted nucleic acid-binding protein
VPNACIDANLVLAWLLPSQRSLIADRARAELEGANFTLIGPPLLYVEVPSVIRAFVHSGKLGQALGEEAFQSFCEMEIESLSHDELHIHAWRLANQLAMSKAYDAQYLAVADLLECDLWTMDQRLSNAVGGRFPRLRLLR